MPPYNERENSWLSASKAATSYTHHDLLAIEAKARTMRAQMVGDAIASGWRYLAERVKALITFWRAPAARKLPPGGLPNAKA